MLRRISDYQKKVIALLAICLLIPAAGIYISYHEPQLCAVDQNMLSEQFQMTQQLSMEEIVAGVPDLSDSYIYYFEERLLYRDVELVVQLDLPEEFDGSYISLGYYDCYTGEWTEIYAGQYSYQSKSAGEQIYLMESENYGYKMFFLYGEYKSGPLINALAITELEKYYPDQDYEGVIPLQVVK